MANCTRPYIVFNFNERGRGNIVLYGSCDEVMVEEARSGSVDSLGRLKNVIAKGKWIIKKKHEVTSEKGMIIKGGSKVSWKTRLYNKNADFTHYLIHPDGNLPGSLGCIVTPDMALELRDEINELLDIVDEIPVYVNVRPQC